MPASRVFHSSNLGWLEKSTSTGFWWVIYSNFFTYHFAFVCFAALHLMEKIGTLTTPPKFRICQFGVCQALFQMSSLQFSWNVKTVTKRKIGAVFRHTLTTRCFMPRLAKFLRQVTLCTVGAVYPEIGLKLGSLRHQVNGVIILIGWHLTFVAKTSLNHYYQKKWLENFVQAHFGVNARCLFTILTKLTFRSMRVPPN